MKKFNKSLLAAAVVGALALPGLASAATFGYGAAGQQITFAKDLIVNNGTTIYTPNGLTLTAVGTNDTANIGTVAATETVTIKVTLTDGAKFDATAPAQNVVTTFKVGEQLGGGVGGKPILATGLATDVVLVGTPYYSASGQELNFTVTVPSNAAIGGAGAYALEINSLQVTNLVSGLFTGSKIGAEITVQNSDGQQVLAGKSDLAKSKWGLAVSADLTGTDAATGATKKIDVGSTNADGSPDPRTWFAANGLVGGSGTNGATANSDWFNLGAVVIDIAEDAHSTGSSTVATTSYVNNYSAILANPEYNVVGTAQFKIKMTADGFASYGATGIKFGDINCSSASLVGAGTLTGNTLELSIPATSTLLSSVTAASPGPSKLYVCALANGTRELATIDSVSASVEVDYNLVTQRVNPTLPAVTLGGIGYNGTDMVFQNINPAANTKAESFLRLTNNNAVACVVEIDGKDDAGKYVKNPVKLTLPKYASAHVNSNDLENGNSAKNITGGFGDGTGRWYVRVTAQCSNFKASALNRNNDTGTVTDLTPEKTEGTVVWAVDKTNHL